jgi:predicted  nucleic acid-binding Zn-ribbon protein
VLLQLRQVKDAAAKEEKEWSAAYQALKAESEALMRVKEDYKSHAESLRANNDSLESAISLLQQQLATAEKVLYCYPVTTFIT